MYTVSNVISLRQFRWNKRMQTVKNVVKDPSFIGSIILILLGVGAFPLFVSMAAKYPDAYLSLMYLS